MVKFLHFFLVLVIFWSFIYFLSLCLINWSSLLYRLYKFIYLWLGILKWLLLVVRFFHHTISFVIWLRGINWGFNLRINSLNINGFRFSLNYLTFHFNEIIQLLRLLSSVFLEIRDLRLSHVPWRNWLDFLDFFIYHFLHFLFSEHFWFHHLFDTS